MQEKISKDPLQIFPDPAVDFTWVAESIEAWGNEPGFQDIGIADAGAEMAQAESGLLEWLSKGYRGEMDYMAKHGTRRTRPAELVSGTLRVISARMNYMPPARDGWQVVQDGDSAFISRYALGRDCHQVLSGRLQELADKITVETGHFSCRVTDSAPVMEVEWAQKSGLGWCGEHTLLLSGEAGSMFFLDELYTDLPLPIDKPVSTYCGCCTKCIDIRPTQEGDGCVAGAPGRRDDVSFLVREHARGHYIGMKRVFSPQFQGSR